ncbi:SixA phosphatase family protein [Amphiplicatus metriothermophilus]|uniref:Phosphohistidine phosphatase n=1 Tax=Amphiplicatus metriothermophilus TaxID=1519374 RepID=A0A239PKD2_9PROT|nr:histidine phosphatase family protein [Amphiplicatus metriothermophilus]MBB5517397.1 phosphohistidine phosphatase [Amphiplicatus metriothermophilus]SNT68268.1 phosphohistidine phosphatase [Amphiplicatus metriothermophilus]
MKRISLLRHAKAEREGRGGPRDFDRPLNARGRKAAAAMGRVLAAAPPDVALCSPAARAKETWARAARALPGPVETIFFDALYAGHMAGRDATGPRAWLERAQGLPDARAHLLVIGHNPGLRLMALALLDAAASDAAAARRLEEKFPTGALARFAFDVARWADIRPGAGRLEALIYPADLEDPL